MATEFHSGSPAQSGSPFYLPNAPELKASPSVSSMKTEDPASQETTDSHVVTLSLAILTSHPVTTPLDGPSFSE